VWFEGQPGSVPHRASASAGQGGGYLDLLYDVPRMLAQLEGVEAGAGRSYLGWLAQARAALEVSHTYVLPTGCVHQRRQRRAKEGEGVREMEVGV